MASQIQILRTEFQTFKNDVIKILEEVVDYLWGMDNLGPERQKTERIKRLINSLKKGG